MKIKDKELEKIVNYYLINSIPLSIFIDNYELNYKQQKMFISYIKSYTKRLEASLEKYKDYNADESSIRTDNIILSKSNSSNLETLKEQFLTLRDLENKLNSSTEEDKKIINRQIGLLRRDICITNIELCNWIINTFFYGIPLPKEDAQMVALEGLIRAINSYNPNMKYIDEYVEFSTYAIEVIVSTLKEQFNTLMNIGFEDYINNQYPDINFTTLFSSEEDKLENIEVLDEDDYYGATDEYEDSTSFMDESIDIDNILMALEDRKILDDVLNELTTQERFIIVKRYNLDGQGKLTLEQLGKILNVKIDVIRNLEAKALKKLRHPRLSTRFNYNRRNDYFMSLSSKSNSYLQEIEHNNPLSVQELDNIIGSEENNKKIK